MTSPLSVQIDSKTYPEAADRPVLAGVHFDIAPAEFVAVIGPSGCGKSTLLHIIAGLDSRFSGQVRWPHGTAAHRLGYVFQNPRLLPWMTVRNNIRLVLDDPAASAGRVEDLLEAMELSAFADYHPNRISIGMQRRVALARAFAVEPEVLLMDEPFVSLDQPTAKLLRSLLLRVWSAHRSRVLFVTHDLHEATQLADRILFLSHQPSSIVGEVEVGIPRRERTSEAVVDTRYRALRKLFDTLYASDDRI